MLPLHDDLLLLQYFRSKFEILKIEDFSKFLSFVWFLRKLFLYIFVFGWQRKGFRLSQLGKCKIFSGTRRGEMGVCWLVIAAVVVYSLVHFCFVLFFSLSMSKKGEQNLLRMVTKFVTMWIVIIYCNKFVQIITNFNTIWQIVIKMLRYISNFVIKCVTTFVTVCKFVIFCNNGQNSQYIIMSIKQQKRKKWPIT